MSTYKCPECGNPINLNERHCANCDYDVTDSEYAALVPAQPTAPAVEKPKAPQVSAPQRPVAASGIDSIMAHGSVDASSHTTHTEDKSTHNIDNSQTVNNTNQTVTNTFIIMGGGPAPIPQNIDPQTAEALKQAQQAQAQQAAQQQAQQEAVPTFSAYAQPQAAAPAQEGSKGIGSIDGTITKNQKKGNKGWIAIVAAVIVVVVVAVVLLGGKEEQETEAQATTNTTTVVTKTNKAAAPKTTTATSQEVSAQKVAAAPTTNKTATAAKPKPKEPTLAEMTPAQAYTKGMQLFDKGNYDQAIAHLEKAANANHADAAYQLGEMYLSGVGVDANKETAIRWYKVAAKAGHKQAKRKLF